MSKKFKQLAANGTSAPAPVPSSAKSPKQIARYRASKALSNARQRCTNEKNPDYGGYGGAGILMLISDIDALISEIGLPKIGESLDRIDPTGHYDLKNVRWTTAAVQAANKKSSSVNTFRSLGAQVSAAKETIALAENRKRTAVAWIRTVKAWNQGFLRDDEAEWLAANLSRAGVIEANFDLDTVFDWSNDSPGHIHLPALSLPDARVRIRCAPPRHTPVPPLLLTCSPFSGR